MPGSGRRVSQTKSSSVWSWCVCHDCRTIAGCRVSRCARPLYQDCLTPMAKSQPSDERGCLRPPPTTDAFSSHLAEGNNRYPKVT